MSDFLKHECGIAMIRLLKPLAYYQEKYSTPLYGFNQLFLLMEKQHNRGQDGAGIGCVKLNVAPGKPYMARERTIKQNSLARIFKGQLKAYQKKVDRGIIHPEFPETVKEQFEFGGEILLGHLRYGTSGIYSSTSCHPYVRRTNYPTKTLMVLGNFNMTNAWDLNHHLIAGLNLRFLDGDTRQTFGGAPNLDVFDPDYGADVAEAPVFKEEASDVTQVGVYLQDEIAFGKWTLLGNLRFDQSNNDLENRLASSETEQDDSEVTGRIAVSYNLENGLMPYATYMTSFLPITGTDVNGRLFQPETAEQIEAGVKYRTDYALFSLGGFNLKREAFVTFDPNRAFGGVQQGEARSRGVEAELRAAPLRGWNVIASYTYLDTKLTDSAAPEEVGEPNPYTPENGASLWTDYTIQTGPLRNLQLGLGARFVGSNYADIFGGRNDSLEVPSELLFDAAIQYRAGAWTLSLTANNLFDEEHVASAFGSFGSNFATYGPTRAARLWLGYAY